MVHRHEDDEEEDENLSARKFLVAERISEKSKMWGFSGRESLRLEREAWLDAEDLDQYKLESVMVNLLKEELGGRLLFLALWAEEDDLGVRDLGSITLVLFLDLHMEGIGIVDDDDALRRNGSY